MRLDIITIQQCNSELKNTIHAYNLFVHGGNSVRCEIQLLKTCCQSLNKLTQVIEINDSKNLNTIKGVYLALKDTYVICLVEGLNPCWKRFVICKEIFHVLFDNPEFVNMDLSAHIEDCVSDTPDVSETPKPAQSEYMAEYAAMEFLFPYSEREALINSGAEIDYDAVAQHYRIPRLYVERYLTEHMMKLASIIIKMG